MVYKLFSISILAFATLCGCTEPMPTRIENIGAINIAPDHYTLSSPEQQMPTAEYAQAEKLIVDNLLVLGFSRSDQAPLDLQISLSKRPANLSLSANNSPLAPAQSAHFHRHCVVSEYRLIVAMVRISDGETLYQSSASETHCKRPLADNIAHLVNAAMADFSQPKGRYVIVGEKDKPAR